VLSCFVHPATKIQISIDSTEIRFMLLQDIKKI